VQLTFIHFTSTFVAVIFSQLMASLSAILDCYAYTDRKPHYRYGELKEIKNRTSSSREDVRWVHCKRWVCNSSPCVYSALIAHLHGKNWM